jgi:hypothetical protein
MATPDQLRALITAQPFRPFTIRMTGGRAFTVKHPENAACDRRGREPTVYDDDGMHLAEMVRVEVMEPVSPSEPGANGA